MKRQRFSLTSDQLELLLAFEDNKGLSQLSETMGRDPSVISRGLQRIAEDFPVLVKSKGRWELTPLGREVNEHTRQFTSALAGLLPGEMKTSGDESLKLSAKSVLIIINAQMGLLDATLEERNNLKAEDQISALLALWRKHHWPVAHIKHVSQNPNSVFHESARGSQFLPALSPTQDEMVFEKTKSSAFHGTLLSNWLTSIDTQNLFLVGFTANECIDASSKDAATLGFTSYVVGDATALFDLRSSDGKLIKADRLHKLTLANINAYSSKVLQTADLLKTRP